MRVALVAVAMVVISGFLAQSPVRDKATHGALAGAHLELTPAFILLAPLGNVYDALTLLGVQQHLVVLVTLITVYLAWRILSARKLGSLGFRVAREAHLALRAFAILLIVYTIGAVVPRPMASLRTKEPDVLILDVHSHTNYSRDTRAGFTPRKNREWHQAAGFHAGYVTDHRSYAGAKEAMANNPPVAGEGYVALSGIELGSSYQHENALGADGESSLLAITEGDATDQIFVTAAAEVPSAIHVQTIPENLSLVRAPNGAGRNGVVAIELSDGAPRGIQQSQRDRQRILHIADSLNLALVAGSNNHGWGGTAVAWNLLRLPCWRAMSSDSLGVAIQNKIRTERRDAVTVAERRSPDTTANAATLAFTLPAVAWNMLVTLSLSERLSWLAWILVIGLVVMRTRLRHS